MSTHHLNIEQKRSWTFAAAVRDGQTPTDLTGYSFALTVKREKGPDAAMVLSRALTVEAAAGRISCALTPAETAALPVGGWPYDIAMTKPSGEVLTLLSGRAVVEEVVGP